MSGVVTACNFRRTLTQKLLAFVREFTTLQNVEHLFLVFRFQKLDEQRLELGNFLYRYLF